MPEQFQLILIFSAVIVGVLSATYFYISTSVFMDLLKRPLKMISGGMFIIAIGVLLAAFISYESSAGLVPVLFGIPLSAYFYILYIIGSIMIAVGSRAFTHRPKGDIVDVSLQKV